MAFPGESIEHGRPFDLVLVAEGFVAGEESAFEAACDALIQAFVRTPPFNLLRANAERIRFWALFLAGTDRGAALGATPGATPLGATYDQATGELSFDQARVNTFVGNTVIPSSQPLYWIVQRGWSFRGMMAVLLPPFAGNQPLTADADTSVVPPGTPPAPRWFVATTIDTGWERVVIEAVARCLGLDDEWSRTEPEFAAPSQETGLVLASATPNLFVGTPPTGVPTESFPWYKELDAATRAKQLTVVPFGGLSPTPDEPIQLFEGGGRYRSGIYRSSGDCFMRRRIGGGSSSPRFDLVDFCVLCRRHLARVLGSTTTWWSSSTIGNQLLQFDRVAKDGRWQRVTQETSFPYTTSVTTTTGRLGEFWAFDLKAGPTHGGLRIENLKLKGQPVFSLATEDVAESIEFRDVAVELANGDQVAFDFAKAFSSTTHRPVLEIAEDGALGLNPVFLHGIKLTLHDDLGGRCLVRLELSLVLKEGATDIEPSAGIYAVKLFPQIGLTWSRPATQSVKRFRACVRTVYNNRVKLAGQGGHPDETVASFFVDTSDSPLLPDIGRRQDVIVGDQSSLPVGFPLWAWIFDYHKPDIRQDTEVYAVYGPRTPNPDYRDGRSADVEWPPGSGHEHEVEKVPDQGQYDNVHLHGSMGVDPFDPGTPKGPMVHAPGCAEACVHLHWRWGAGADFGVYVGGNEPVSFRGWPRSRWSVPRANRASALPLIPPNQDLKIAVTNPTISRPSPWDDVVRATADLDPRRKAIWYTAEVTGPARDQRQVIHEMGVSFAYVYNQDAPLTILGLDMARRATRPLLVPGPVDARPPEEILHLQYSLSRWFFDAPSGGGMVATGEQIPPGTQVGDTGVALEDL